MQAPNIEIFDSKISHNYIKNIKESFENALEYKSKLPSWILDLDGMSGKKYRHFINNLISSIYNPRYLEIGTWQGSTFCSAIFDNNVVGYAVDNWSEFGGPKEQFEKNVKKCIEESKEDLDLQTTFEENNFTDVEYLKIGKYNVYLFDGPHTYEDQYNALSLASDALDNEYIYICDDWNWQHLREATHKAIDELGIEVLYSIELLTSQEDYENGISHQNSDWHNGYYIGVMRKK